MNMAPVGLRGLLMQRQQAGQEQNNQLAQAQGLLAMNQAQLQQGALQQQQADKLRQQAYIDAFAQSLPADQQIAFRVDPAGFIKRNNEEYTLTPGAIRYRGGQQVAAAPQKPEAPSPLAKAIQEMNSLPDGDPRRAVYQSYINKQTTHAPASSATVNVKQETEFGKAVGKEFGDIYTGAIKAEFNAPKTIANYDRLGNLLSQVNTGKFAGTTTDLKAAAKTLGVDLTAMGIRDDVAPAQATKQISNMLALELRNPAGGAGMPGAMSDKDREFLQQSIPSIENDPAAIGEMIKYRKLLAKRDQEVGKMAREYRKRTGRFDEGFFDELRDFSEKNPLFPQTTVTPSAAPTWRVVKPAGGN